MNDPYERVLYLYSRALEESDFEAISRIMQQAADDPTLKALLFDLEAAYQVEFSGQAAPNTMEVPMIGSLKRSNGYHPLPEITPRRRMPTKRHWTGWAAGLGTAVLVLLIVVQYTLRDSARISTTLITSGQPALVGYPVISAQNAPQLAEIRHYGTGLAAGATWSPDSQTVLVYGYGLWFYEAKTMTSTRTLDTGTYILSAAYSPDGSRIAVGNVDGSVQIYDAASGEEQLAIPAYPNLALRVAFSPDGLLLATVGGDDSTVQVWDTTTGRERFAFHDLDAPIISVEFSPDGTLLAANGLGTDFTSGGSEQGERSMIALWDTASGQRVLTLRGPAANPHRISITSIAFSPDSQQVIAGTWEGVIYRWAIDHAAAEQNDGYLDPAQEYTDARFLDPVGSPSIVYAVAYRPDGSLFASLNNDFAVRLWKGDEIQAIPLRDADGSPLIDIGSSLAFSPDGQRLLVMDIQGRILVWDLTDTAAPALLANRSDHNSGFKSVALSADNQWIAAGEWQGRAWAWDTATGAVVNHLDSSNHGGVQDLAFSPTGKLIAVGQTPPMVADPGYSVLLWSLDPGTAPLSLGEPTGYTTYSVAFNADGTRLFAGGNDGLLRQWDVASHEVLSTLNFAADGSSEHQVTTKIALNPAGSVVAFVDIGSRMVRLWDVTAGRELPALVGHSEAVNTLAFNADGSRLASVDSGGNLIVWDTATWTEAWYAPKAGGYESVEFSPDGKLLALAGNEGIALWDVAAQQQVMTLAGDSGGVQEVTFSRDGSLLVTAGADGLVRVWAAAPQP